MTVQPKKSTSNPAQNSSLNTKLAKLQAREAALRAQGQQLKERAAHLERVRCSHAKHLARRVDAHEKVVLGALVKKAGLDICRLDAVISSKRQLNDVVLPSIDGRLDKQSANYDRELILGALLWLASVLDQPPGGVVRVPHRDRLRDAGGVAGAR